MRRNSPPQGERIRPYQPQRLRKGLTHMDRAVTAEQQLSALLDEVIAIDRYDREILNLVAQPLRRKIVHFVNREFFPDPIVEKGQALLHAFQLRMVELGYPAWWRNEMPPKRKQGRR